MERRYGARRVDPAVVPSTEEAVQAYEQLGGHLTYFPAFGRDPLADSPLLSRRRLQNFQACFPSFETLFYNLVNGDSTPFENALLLFLQLTRDLAQ